MNGVMRINPALFNTNPNHPQIPPTYGDPAPIPTTPSTDPSPGALPSKSIPPTLTLTPPTLTLTPPIQESVSSHSTPAPPTQRKHPELHIKQWTNHSPWIISQFDAAIIVCYSLRQTRVFIPTPSCSPLSSSDDDWLIYLQLMPPHSGSKTFNLIFIVRSYFSVLLHKLFSASFLLGIVHSWILLLTARKHGIHGMLGITIK